MIALAMVGAGTGWLAFQRFQESADMQPLPVADSTIRQATALPPATPAIGDSNASDGDAATLASAPASDDSIGVTTEELQREYGDPTIARDAKLAIQRVLDTALDQSRYEVFTVICHEKNCQIFSNPKVSGADKDWPPIIEAILQELARTSFRDPQTGAELKPTLMANSRGRAKNAVTVTIIGLR